jgi:hypothetical protein
LLRTGTGLASPDAVKTDAAGNPYRDAAGNPISLSAGGFPLQPMDPAMLQQVAPFNATQQAGLQYLGNSAVPEALLAGQGANELSRTMGGAYLSPDTNPHLDATYGSASRGLVDQYRMATAPSLMAQAQQAGVSGGSAEGQQQAFNQYGLGQNLSDLATQIYGGNYQTERGRQLSALGMVPGAQTALAVPGQQLLGAGTLEQGQAQTELDVSRQNAELQQEYPYHLISYLTNLMGGVTGAGGTTTAGTSK